MSRPAPPLDVLDHRFGAGDPLTVGVEEEYMLLDADTLDLAQRVECILRAEEHGAFADRERYHALLDVLQYAGRRELIFGLHVHVAVDDPDRAIRLMGALQAHLCELVALSANSPLWRGEPTGFASCRHLIFSGF